MPPDDALEARVQATRPLADAVCLALAAEMERLGFAAGELSAPRSDEALFHLDPDPASGEDALIGKWRDARGQNFGSMVFHADGSFFAEYDVVRVHPRKPRWFVEAVTAWGRDGAVKSEPRLLPMPE